MGGRKKSSTSEKDSAGDGLGRSPSYTEMKADRLAALNLIEDAVAAKRAAENLSAELRERESWLIGQKEAFQAAMNTESLESSLNHLVNTAIRHYRDANVRAAFYLADWDHKTFRHAAGMPEEYPFDVDDFEMETHSLETGDAVITPDVREEPRWEPWLWMAEKHDYRGFWSFALRTRNGPILGIFVLYFDRPRDATPRDHELAALITHTAAIIISSYNEAAQGTRIQESLRRKEEKYRTLFETIDEGFAIVEVIFDEAGQPIDYLFIETNPAFERHTGLRDAVGQTMRSLIPDHEQVWFDVYGRVALTGKPERFEGRAAALGYWYNVFAFPTGSPDQNHVAIVFNDVSQRKRTNEALRESNERMRLLIEGITESAIFTMDPDGSIDTWNTGSERLYGYREDEIIGQHFIVLFTDEDKRVGLPERELETARTTGRSVVERWHVRKDGSTFFASGVVQPLGENRDEGFVKIARDVTERLRAESAQREKDLLKTLVTAQELERSRIARDLHDELGQQMTALRLKLELAGIQANGNLLETIGEIKEIARKIDEGVDFLAWELRPAALDDLGLIPAIGKYVREWSGYSGVAISFDSSIGAARFSSAVETTLYRVVQESLNNVHKHASAADASVRLMSRDNSLMLIIDDNGVGFDLEDPTVRTRGIGLIGMGERIKTAGGTLDIESKTGAGTTLYVTIPVSPEIIVQNGLEPGGSHSLKKIDM